MGHCNKNFIKWGFVVWRWFLIYTIDVFVIFVYNWIDNDVRLYNKDYKSIMPTITTHITNNNIILTSDDILCRHSVYIGCS